jgi:N-acetylneuraminic acid mutarotase
MANRLGVMVAVALLAGGCAAGPGSSPTGAAEVTPSATPMPSAAGATPQLTPTLNAGSWAATGSLATARYDHTATLLLDGRVLVVGGARGNGDAQSGLASAELYDPATRSWTKTGSMAASRTEFTATLLLDGRVLVVGGNPYEPLAGCDTPSCSAEQATAELFDPKTGRWSATGHMSVGRAGHTATRLADGRVLVAGGVGGGISLRSTDIYAPATGTWSKTGAMAAGRAGHGAVALADGSVLVAGGFGETGPLGTAERYDPTKGTWAAAGTLPGVSIGTATLLSDGRVLLAGGDTGLAQPHSADLFDPTSDSWSATGSMITARQSHVTVLLPDGRVLAAGGWNVTQSATSFLNTAEIYDPTTGTWTATASTTVARAGATATALKDGTVLLVGGDAGSGAGNSVPTASVEIFTPGG